MSKDLEKYLQEQLRASEAGLDAPTLARLHAARNRALDAAKAGRKPRSTQGWLAAGAAASTVAIALLVAVRPQADVDKPATAEFESTLLAAAGGNEIIAPVNDETGTAANETAETLDLLENLDFYEWLSQVEAEEQQT